MRARLIQGLNPSSLLFSSFFLWVLFFSFSFLCSHFPAVSHFGGFLGLCFSFFKDTTTFEGISSLSLSFCFFFECLSNLVMLVHLCVLLFNSNFDFEDSWRSDGHLKASACFLIRPSIDLGVNFLDLGIHPKIGSFGLFWRWVVELDLQTLKDLCSCLICSRWEFFL